MQNRYFGDVGDFGKYSLLRALSGCHPVTEPLRLGVIWYLTDDENHNNDGKHVGYLTQPAFADCDPELLALLRSLSRLPRRVDHLHRTPALGSATTYYDATLNLAPIKWQERQAARTTWFGQALDATGDCDLVFCDPDNGLSDNVKLLRSGKGGKFAAFSEVAAVHARGQSVVVYHHADRSASVDEQAKRRLSQLRDATGSDQAFAVRFMRGTTRLYLIAPGAHHAELLRKRTQAFLESPWRAHFCPAPHSD